MKLIMTITACFLIPCYVGFRTVGVSPMAHNGLQLNEVADYTSKLNLKNRIMNTKKTSLENESQPSCLGAISRSYLVLYENNPDRISGSIEKFDGEIMSAVNFEANKSEDFATMKKWALKNGKKIFIIEAVMPLVKIIPEVTVVNNCG